MNGNRFVARALRQARPTLHLTYFEPYGDQQPARWSAARDRLAARSSAPTEVDAIVAAAQRTFDAITDISDELVRDESSSA
jgi:heme oxygenase